MTLQNNLWMLKLVLRKKWPGVAAILAAVYLVLMPYQKNLLSFFGDAEAAKYIFWDSVWLYHSIFAVTFVYLAAAQLMSSELLQLRRLWKKQTRIVLASVFLVYLLLASPEYAWYFVIYPEQTVKLLLLFLLQIVSTLIFYIFAEISKKALIGYAVVFIGLLAAFF